jgi:hypothetical protein
MVLRKSLGFQPEAMKTALTRTLCRVPRTPAHTPSEGPLHCTEQRHQPPQSHYHCCYLPQ